MLNRILVVLTLVSAGVAVTHAQQKAQRAAKRQPPAEAIPNPRDARNTPTGNPAEARDPEFAKFAIYEQSAPRPVGVPPIATTLPLALKPGDRIGFIGNTLFERAQLFGHIEAFLQQRFPRHQLVFRNLSWAADTIDLAPRPANFADVEQHLTHLRLVERDLNALANRMGLVGSDHVDRKSTRLNSSHRT